MMYSIKRELISELRAENQSLIVVDLIVIPLLYAWVLEAS